MTNQNKALLGLGAVGLVFFLTQGSSSGGNPVTTAFNALIPGGAASSNTPMAMVGINVNNQVANYAQLAAADPNLLNPNYQMTLAQSNQYLSNYLDLQQGLPAWVNHKVNGVTTHSLPEAAQLHWKIYGCAEKRIFYPFSPPSNKPYVPPPANPKSSGGGLFGTLLKVGTIVAGGVITVASGGTAAPLVAAGESAALAAENAAFHGIDVLSDADLAIAFNGAAIAKAILPFFQGRAPQAVQLIENKIDQVLKTYA